MKKKDKQPASESQTEDSDDALPEKKSFFKKIFSLKFIIIFTLLILVIGGATFAGWFFFLKKDTTDIAKETKPEAVAQTTDGKAVAPPEPDFPDIVDLEPFEKIRLQDSASLNYLTLKIAIELVKPDMRKTVEESTVQIRQAVEAEIKKMTWLVLRSPEGKLNFKYLLIKELNGVLPSKMIQNIYFTNFIMQ